jgi:hypothetical protein
VQRGIRQRTSGGSRPAAAGCRKRTGRCTRTGSGGPGGTSRQHKAKSSIHQSQAGILGARVRKDACLPREIRRAVRSKGMVEILWPRRETRRQTEKTNFDLKPERTGARAIAADRRAEVSRGHSSRRETSRDETSAEDSPRQRPERSPPEWTRVNDSGQ